MTPMTPMTPLHVVDAGSVPYLDAYAWQKRLAQARGADQCPDTLLLLEHPHTYTLGSAGNADNILLTPEALATRQIDVHRTDRGGDVTYHGPGQVVGYPILKLPPTLDNLHADVIAYLRHLEAIVIAAVASFGISGWRLPPLTGVWIGDADAPAKLCAIGVKLTTRRVTLHGFALNVNTDMSYFDGIVPCGIRDKAVISMQQALGHAVPLADVKAALSRAFAAQFGYDVSAMFAAADS
jgi:lipoyl(octanoyl) transferase